MILRRNGRKALEASSLISEMVGRGPYYSIVIRAWAKQWMTQRIVPEFKRGLHVKVKSLLDDEDVDLAVSSYLRANKFAVTPQKLKKHLEEEIFPTLALSVSPIIIREETVGRWMKKKGWHFGLHKKGVYVDGHEGHDVVDYRKQFLQEMLDLEPAM